MVERRSSYYRMVGKRVNIVLVDVGKPPRWVQVWDKLNELQALVGGNVEALCMGRGLMLLCDEDGRGKSLPQNRVLPVVGTVYGDFLLCGVNREGGTDELWPSHVDWIEEVVGPIEGAREHVGDERRQRLSRRARKQRDDSGVRGVEKA